MDIIPAIDIYKKKCVRFTQGDPGRTKIYSNDPIKVADSFIKEGADIIHIVDMSSAIDHDNFNLDIIESLMNRSDSKFQIGGGINTIDKIENLLKLGAYRVIIGSEAVNNPNFIKEAVHLFGSDKICISIDVRQNKIAINGWKNNTDEDYISFGNKMKDYGVNRFIVTDILKDGTLEGHSIQTTALFARSVNSKITASGGIGSLHDFDSLLELADYGVDSIITGKAIYEGRFSYMEAVQYVKSRRQNAD